MAPPKDRWIVCYSYAAGPYYADTAEAELAGFECPDPHQIVISDTKPVTRLELARAEADREANEEGHPQ